MDFLIKKNLNNNAQDIIDTLDPDMRQCHECENFFHKYDYKFIPNIVRSDDDKDHNTYRICWKCFNDSRKLGGKNYGISE